MENTFFLELDSLNDILTRVLYTLFLINFGEKKTNSLIYSPTFFETYCILLIVVERRKLITDSLFYNKILYICIKSIFIINLFI